jgi:putative membrane protein
MAYRWRRDLLSQGSDPDPRFTLANERTFLAWIRTSLALIAGGLGLETFVDDTVPPLIRTTLAAALTLLGALIAGLAFRRWYCVERAIRHETQLPLSVTAPLLAVGVCTVAVTLVAVVVLR